MPLDEHFKRRADGIPTTIAWFILFLAGELSSSAELTSCSVIATGLNAASDKMHCPDKLPVIKFQNGYTNLELNA